MLTLDHAGRQRQPSTEAFHRALSRRSTTYELLTKRNRAKIDEDAFARQSSPMGSSVRSGTSHWRVRMADNADDKDRSGSDAGNGNGQAASDVSSQMNSGRTRGSINVLRPHQLDRERQKPDQPVVNIPMQETVHFMAFNKEDRDSAESGADLLEFPIPPPIPTKSAEVRQAEISLLAFSELAREDSHLSHYVPENSNRYFYGRRPPDLRPVKLRVVNVGPDTAKLSLPAYATRLIKLIKYRRTRLQEIERGLCLFRHENITLLRHDLQVYERALKPALRMLKDSQFLHMRAPPRPVVANELSTRVIRPAASHALMRMMQPINYTLDDLMADVSLSGVSDLLSCSSEKTSILEEEVEELRKSLRKVREDIAYILEEEEEARLLPPPPKHIMATRQCSIHSLSSSIQ